MEIKTRWAQDRSGNVLPFASVSLFYEGTTDLVSGLEDSGGNPLSNPFQSDVNGKAVFAAPDGQYDIKFSSGPRESTASIQFLDVSGALQVVENIDALRSIAGNSGRDYILAKFHTSDGDGGGGNFYWESGAAPGTYVDNGGTIIVPTGWDGSSAWIKDFSNSYVPGGYKFRYLTGAISSLAASVPKGIAVGDTINVTQYAAGSPVCPAAWQLVADNAALPSGAVAGDVTGAAAGCLYLANGSAYYKFEFAGENVNIIAFGAKPSSNIAPHMQAAADSSKRNKKKLYIPGGNYALAAPVDAYGVYIYGDGQQYSVVTASALMSHMVEIGNRSDVSGVFFDGANLATHVITGRSANGSVVHQCRLERAKRNGLHYQKGSNNNSALVIGNLIRNNGFEYTTGTVDGTAAGSTLTFTGAADLTTLGIDPEYDFVYVTDDSRGYAYEITAVTATTLSIYRPLADTVSGSAFRIVGGAGIMIERNADNNVVTIMGNSIHTNKGAGIQDHGLFGSKSIGNTYDNKSGIARVIGRRAPPSQFVTTGSIEIGNYHESSVDDALYYANAVGDNVIFGHLGQAPKIVTNHGLQVPPVFISSTPRSVLPATGLQFPATQVPSADVNTLDDYEEGTFSPLIAGSTSAGTATYTHQVGWYTKIGNRVFFDIRVTWTGATGTGELRVAGLPFPATTASLYRSSVSVGYSTGVTIPAGATLAAQVALSTSYVDILATPAGGGTSAPAPVASAGQLVLSGSYRV